ncbi:hypothetical protein A3G53_01180 [Candidatus Nomurabacteria bacterium RIFCSPLOWO2_12_FULL_44_11]|uniref:Peptidase S51 n=1 Tax=Candidatus Nomurabacteria bacterium RIFCSPLOWO2_12_FULL_44_11 TaxID=1801796 RepID=A0A1F6Y7Y8_9BACT|nr:MAG: hypothetical protein A3G53_01180 [Candidatus Nomurabacteria bacterium RIFCSPLOWO2_12_FULL_44_11]
MKLLLTSDGITNPSIAKALFGLIGKKPEETSLAFIPTAVNVAKGDKGWFVEALHQLHGLGLKYLDIVDISAMPKNIWLPRLESADVLFFCGGNSSHLMRWIKESGLRKILPNLLEKKVYASLSAGSTITAPDLALSKKEHRTEYANSFGYNSEDALNLVDFYTQSHLNSPNYPERTEEKLKELAKNFKGTIYALDYNSVLKVTDGKVEIISEGKYLKL